MDDDTLRWFLRDDSAMAWARAFITNIEAAVTANIAGVVEDVARIHDEAGHQDIANGLRDGSLGVIAIDSDD